MKIVIAQFYSKNVSYGEFAEKINRNYCEKNNYEYYVETDTEKMLDKLQGRSWTWYKPHLIKDVFEKYPDCDYVFFLDIDAIFSSNDRRIEEFIVENNSITMTTDYGPSLVNAGVMLLKHDDYSKEFLNKWWDICEEFPQYKTGLWHDQTCIGILWDRIDTNKFRIIEPFDMNAREYDETKLVFHAFSYGSTPNRTIDSIFYKKFNINTKNLEMKNLNELGHFYGTDKAYLHNYYNRFYQETLSPYKNKCDILEIGVLDGKSVKVWEDFFDEGTIHGIDIKHVNIDNERTKLFICDQSDEQQLEEFSNKNYMYDVIIDDGSHRMKDLQITVQKLFRNLKPGGLFILEDLQTSLECRMPEKAVFGWGDPSKTTCLDMLNSIIDGNPITDYKTDQWEYFIQNIESLYISNDRTDSIYCVIKKK